MIILKGKLGLPCLKYNSYQITWFSFDISIVWRYFWVWLRFSRSWTFYSFWSGKETSNICHSLKLSEWSLKYRSSRSLMNPDFRNLYCNKAKQHLFSFLSITICIWWHSHVFDDILITVVLTQYLVFISIEKGRIGQENSVPIWKYSHYCQTMKDRYLFLMMCTPKMVIKGRFFYDFPKIFQDNSKVWLGYRPLSQSKTPWHLPILLLLSPLGYFTNITIQFTK